MSEVCPTVKVDNPDEKGGFMIINESDFDKEKHTVFGEKKPARKRKAKAA